MIIMDNRFQQATLDLIDDHYDWLKSDERVEEFRKQFPIILFAEEMQSLCIKGRRQVGHSTLINKLAFDVASEVGRKYSTFIIAPKYDMASYNYRAENIYFNMDDLDSAAQHLAMDYCNEFRNIAGASRTGKVITAEHIRSRNFNSRIFLEKQKAAIKELTGATVDKFDLCLIDVSGMRQVFTQEVIDYIYAIFINDVELFVFLE